MLFWIVFGRSANPMALLSPERRVLAANRPAAALTGYARDDLVGRPLDTVLVPEDRGAVEAAWHEVWQRGSFEGDRVVFTSDGRRLDLQYAMRRVRLDAGDVVLSVVIDSSVEPVRRSAVGSWQAGMLSPREIEYLAKSNRPDEDPNARQQREARDNAITQDFIGNNGGFLGAIETTAACGGSFTNEWIFASGHNLFDWAGTSGLSFGICRASQGLGAAGTNSPDPFLAWNWPRIKAEGLARGAYHFLDPGLSGAAQASYFVETVSQVGLEVTDMLWLDNETAGSSPAAVAACARDFMAELVSLRPHNPCGVYSYWDFITSGNCAGLGSYPLWLAIYQSATPGAPPPWQEWTFWQSGGTSTYDNDQFAGTPAELTAWIQSFQPNVEVEVQSGQLNNGANAVTVITVPHGTGTNVTFGCDNGLQGLPPAVLRVAIHDENGWHVTNSVTVDSTKGQTGVSFPNPASTGVVSVRRQDAGQVVVGYEVS